MATIMIPIPLIHCGLLPEPHLARGTEVSALGSMSADELREFFRHALFTLHPCFVLITWAGYEVLDIEVAQVVGGAVTGTPARLDLLTMEIAEGHWTTPAGTMDGIFVVLLMRPRPGLPGPPLPLTVGGVPLAGELDLSLDEDVTQPWDRRLAELLPQLEGWAGTVADEFRTAIRSARGSLAPGAWMRDSMLSGFLSMYDYSSWHFEVLEAALRDASAPIAGVGQEVWASITASTAAFDRFLEEEPVRAGGLASIIFPGLPMVSALQRVSALDPPGTTSRADALSHNVDAANVVYPSVLSQSDLDLLSYTELLVVANEIEAVDIAPAILLTGEALRQQILVRLDELAPVAHQVIEDLEDWQETNYSDLAHTLEGEVPSYAMHDWWLGFYANLFAEIIGSASPLAARSLVVWIAGAGATISIGAETAIGFVVGLGASVVLSDLLAPSEAEEARRLTDAHERSLFLEELWHQKVRDAAADSSRRLDEEITQLRLRVGPFTDEAELQALYSAVMADLETCVQHPVPPLTDRSLADLELYLWLLDVGWGFTPYDDEGVYTPTPALVTKIRNRVLVWPAAENPTLFISQCEYEWRSLGFVCDAALETLRTESKYGATFSQQLIDGREVALSGFEIDPIFRAKWTARYSSTLTVPASGASIGSTFVTERGIREIGNGAFTARCTLRLAVTSGSCRVTAFDYRLEGNGDYFAQIYVDVNPDPTQVSRESHPNTYHEYRVVPDHPVYAP
jgi:hypothetical protein